MNKTIKVFFVFVSIFFSNIALSSDNIYYIDMNFIMNNSLAGKSIIKQLGVQNKSYSELFKKTEIDLKKEETKIISQKNILDKQKFDEKVDLFNKKVSQYTTKRNDTLKNLTKKKNEAQKNLVKKLTPILSDYSQKNSISFILPKQNIIIGKSELDLTKIIIEILNKETQTIKLK